MTVLAKAHVITLALEVVEVTPEITKYAPNQRKARRLAVRYCEEHHLHRHEGLPAGLQILLPCRQEREGADALGGGQDLYRLCT